MLFPRHLGTIPTSSSTPGAHPSPTARVPCMYTVSAAATTRTTPPTRVRVRVLGGRHVRPSSQQLVPVLAVQHLVARGLQRIHLLPVGRELGAEVADALVGLLLLGRVELLLREGVVLVDGLLEGGQRCAEGAEGGGAEDGIGGAGAARVGGGGR